MKKEFDPLQRYAAIKEQLSKCALKRTNKGIEERAILEMEARMLAEDFEWIHDEI